MRNLGFITTTHRPESRSLQGKAYEGIEYIETSDSREQDDVLLDLAQTWYREQPELFISQEQSVAH